MRRPEERSRWLVPVIGIGLVCVTLWLLFQFTGGSGSVMATRIQATDLAIGLVDDAAKSATKTVTSLMAKVGVGLVEHAEDKPVPPASTKPPARTPARPASRPQPTPVVTELASNSPETDHGPFSDRPAGENAPMVSILGLEEPPTVQLLEAGFGGRVFSEFDEGVTTPRPLQPMLTTDAPRGFDREALGVAEYVVDHRGRVEYVRLVKESARLQDRMVLSVIKAWRFEPAYKDGQPVRYRQTIVLTQ